MIAHELKAFKEEDVLQRETESFKQALSSSGSATTAPILPRLLQVSGTAGATNEIP